MIEFFLPIDLPRTTSQGAGKRLRIANGIPIFYKSAAAKDLEARLALLCAENAPKTRLDGPVALTTHFILPWRKTESKARKAMGLLPHTTRPDASNIIKILEDVLTKTGFWHDDSQIADLRVRKSWGDRAGISVQIKSIQTV